MLTVVACLIGVELRCGEEEAAIEVLATLDVDAGTLENGIRDGYARCTQCLDDVPCHGEVHMACVWRRSPASAPAPASINRISAMPTILVGELLFSQVLPHGLDLAFPAWTARPAQRTDSQRRGVVRI